MAHPRGNPLTDECGLAEMDEKISDAQEAFLKRREEYRHDTTINLVELDRKVDGLAAKAKAATGNERAKLDASLKQIRGSRADFAIDFGSLEHESSRGCTADPLERTLLRAAQAHLRSARLRAHGSIDYPRGLDVAFVIALLVGVLTGYFGAILPGPVNFSVMSKVARNQGRAALLIAVGGASMDAAFCVAVGLGVGWFGALVSQPVVRLILAIFLAGYGMKLAFFDPDPSTPTKGVDVGRPGGGAPPASRGSVFVGALQGAANPALIFSWTIIIGFLVAHGMIQANVAGTVGFSIGVALGGMGWFCSLIGLLQHFASSPVIRWWKRSTPLGGGVLLALGAWYALKTFHDL